MNVLRALRSRPFALLWSGQTISSVGDFVYEIALAWWVVRTTGSAVAMGTVLACTFVPMLLFLLIGGALVDRLPRVPVMLLSDLLRAAAVGTVAALALAGRLQFWQLCVASLLFGTVDAFFRPAYSAIVPQLTEPEALHSANALTSFSQQAGRILGPALGATLVAFAGPGLAFAIDAVSFGVSALLIAPLLRNEARWAVPVPEIAHQASLLASVRDGFRTVFAAPWLAITICSIALSNVMLSGPYTVAIPFLVRDRYPGGVHMLGLLYATFPVGYLLAALWLGRQHHIRRRGLLLYGGTIVAGAGMLVVGLPVGIGIVLLAALVNGAALQTTSQVWTNTLQELVPNELLGRITSIDLLGTFALLPLGFALTGWATNLLGGALVCMLGGCLAMLVGLFGLAQPTIRRLN